MKEEKIKIVVTGYIRYEKGHREEAIEKMLKMDAFLHMTADHSVCRGVLWGDACVLDSEELAKYITEKSESSPMCLSLVIKQFLTNLTRRRV